MGNLTCSETLSNLLMTLLFPEFQTGVALASDEDFAESFLSPLAAKHKTNNIVAMAMEFEAKHRECVRVLTYTYDGHVKVKLYVLSGKTGIPETLKAAAQDYFKEMNVKLEWLDLYKDADEILQIRPLEYSSGKRKALTDSQVNELTKLFLKISMFLSGIVTSLLCNPHLKSQILSRRKPLVSHCTFYVKVSSQMVNVPSHSLLVLA